MSDVTMTISDPGEERRVHKFFVPGLKPDVRLKVFGTKEYHVHSVLLKLHSGFYRAFLDSPEKQIPASSEFTYEWVTELDDEGGWYLVAAQSAPQKVCTPFISLQYLRGLYYFVYLFLSLLLLVYGRSREPDQSSNIVFLAFDCPLLT